MRTLTFAISGMTCDHCVRAVEGAVRSVPGVTHVEVELSEGSARVQGDAIAPGAVEAAVADEGYAATLAGAP